MQTTNLVNRGRYLEEALLFRDTDLVKVIMGVRRCGKSSLMALVRRAIEAEGVAGRAFLELNLESKKCPVKDAQGLYSYFADRQSENGRTYIFIDEPQRIEGWQDAINALRVDLDCDIYLTGSNAYLLSSALSTYLSGRYVEIRMLPLSFCEYVDFCGVEFKPGRSIALDATGNPIAFDDMFERYLKMGGMPAIASLDTTQAKHSLYISSLYEAIASRDIINRERNKEQSRVTNPELLRSIADFLADNVGNTSAPSSIANTLTSTGTKTTHPTVKSYVAALNEAFLFYRTPRYDLHGKALLQTNPKEYIVDSGLRSWLGGYRMTDMGRVFENAVYLQLLYKGYTVHVGKLYDKEIDFVAIKDSQRLYIQVADELSDEKTKERELAPLQSLRESFPKMIVVRQGSYETDINGIRIIHARDFFLDE